jgi:CRP/FNR family transcriptional regulator, dissimilatory nitrate respiration regulator
MNSPFLSNTALFRDVTEEEIERMLICLAPREKEFRKGEVIFHAGSVIHEVGMVESGCVNIVVNFYWGDSQIFGHITEGMIFGENYAAVPDRELIPDVVAAAPSKILLFDINRLLNTCRLSCACHHKVIQNLLRISAENSLNLSARMLHTASRSLRGRLLSYLSEQAQLNGSEHFTIPFDRQQLANYLSVDRSAMSNELSKMRKDGLIVYRKNEFTLKEKR